MSVVYNHKKHITPHKKHISYVSSFLSSHLLPSSLSPPFPSFHPSFFPISSFTSLSPFVFSFPFPPFLPSFRIRPLFPSLSFLSTFQSPSFFSTSPHLLYAFIISLLSSPLSSTIVIPLTIIHTLFLYNLIS